jgi:hypothetical protein
MKNQDPKPTGTNDSSIHPDWDEIISESEVSEG